MKLKFLCSWLMATGFLMSVAGQQAQAVSTVEEYNQSIPVWGTSWTPGRGATSHYYPSFYTGFAMRSSFPDRIHVRQARGNQARVSVILDDETIRDYLFDLMKRYETYQLSSSNGLVNTTPRNAHLTPHLDHFFGVVESSAYQIKETVEASQLSTLDQAALYEQSLRTLEALNPGRVFRLNIDLAREFDQWRQRVNMLDLNDDEDVIIALNTLVFGRVNYVERPDQALISQLRATKDLALAGSEDDFFRSAINLFRMATGDKYDFQVYDSASQAFTSPIQCDSPEQCTLSYPEFTAIYPMGSLKGSVRDRHGNRIPAMATPGLWVFLSRGQRHDVDNIREKAYYGWAPKMDYEAIGNGYHNPAVRFVPGSSVKNALEIPSSHQHFWSVKRGGVSHGCARLPLGHVWEMRHIFPVENEQMVQIYAFNNRPTDFDVYDIDGDGELEVMGVDYTISYTLRGSSGLARREASSLDVNSERTQEFHNRLYGARDVFEVRGEESYFIEPTISFPSYMDLREKRVDVTLRLDGEYRLYEQAYEQDKVQFYRPHTSAGLTSGGKRPLSKRIARIMGRIRGCAPTTDKSHCGENAFDEEYAGILREAGLSTSVPAQSGGLTRSLRPRARPENLRTN